MNQDNITVQLRYHVRASDADSVRRIVTTSGFFRVDEIEVAIELVEEVLAHGGESGYSFVFAEVNGTPVAYCCYGPIPCTIGAFDLYWIATHEQFRGQGVGRLLLLTAEAMVKKGSGRILYIETSGMERYDSTRSFYVNNGYTQAAYLKDYYQDGDDKIIYEKRL